MQLVRVEYMALSKESPHGFSNPSDVVKLDVS